MNIVDNKKYYNDIKRVSQENTLNFEKFKNKRILITGGSGLIGSSFVDVIMYRNIFFEDNITLYLMCRNESKLLKRFEKYNIKRYDSNEKSNIYYIIQNVCEEFEIDIRFDYIIHAASNTHPMQYSTDPVGTITTNILGMNNILKYSLKYKPERIFLSSSVEIYGENKSNVEKFSETDMGYIDCNTARAGYPESKRLCESLCQSYINQYKMDIVIGRFSRVYGPTMLKDDSKALAQFIKNAINKENIILKSEGKQFYSYVHVIDAVTAMIKIITDGEDGEAYNIADEKSDITLKELTEIIASYSNSEVIFELPTETEKKGYSAATKAILLPDKIKTLGWKPYYDIKKGIITTIDILDEIGFGK